MKKYRDTIKNKVKRLVLAILGQLVWGIPVGILGWYLYKNLPLWTDDYFGVQTTQKLARSWAKRVTLLENPVVWNPSAIAAYLKALGMSTVISTKAYTVASLSGMAFGIGRLLLDILGVLAVFYAVIRIKRAYRRQAQETAITNAVCAQILPEIEQLKKQLSDMEQLLRQPHRQE